MGNQQGLMGDCTPAGHDRYGRCIKRTVRALTGLDCFHHMMYDLSQAMRCLGQPGSSSTVPLSFTHLLLSDGKQCRSCTWECTAAAWAATSACQDVGPCSRQWSTYS